MENFVGHKEKMYFGRTRRPHCPTCVCPQHEVKVTTSRVAFSTHNKPVKIFYRSPPKLEQLPFDTCGCDCPIRNVWDCCEDEPCPARRTSPARVERRVYTEHKYTLLEKWFKRFDFDGNGLLDVFELRTLLNFLGATVGDGYCKRLMGNVDRDRDGRLTFPEFLMMWRGAQEEDELVEIIREYDLYPDVLHVTSIRKQPPNTQITETLQQRFPKRRGCHCENRIRKTFHADSEDSCLDFAAIHSHVPRSYDKLPVFSCYR